MVITTTRRDIKDTFKTLLDAATLGVPVYRDKPPEGVPVPSVVFTLISGVSRTGSIGRQESPTQLALEEWYRLQIDCYYDDSVECDNLAGKVEQAIVEHEDALRSTYGVENVQKLDDGDVGPQNEMSRECRIRMDFGFTMYRAVA